MQIFGEEEVDLIDCESGVFEEGRLKDILRLYDTPRGPNDRVLKVKVCPLCLMSLKWTHRCIIRTGHLKTLSRAAHLPKYMKNSKIGYHFPV
jgi:hypothetical protein